MKTSERGLNLIKRFEGLRLTAYKAVLGEKYYTIGYGHYGSDVTYGMSITEEEATKYLIADIQKAEKAVNDLNKYYEFNQNQFDALVSFTFNCGKANLTKLTNKHSRSLSEIAQHLPLYCKSCGKTLVGLKRRRIAELELFTLVE